MANPWSSENSLQHSTWEVLTLGLCEVTGSPHSCGLLLHINLKKKWHFSESINFCGTLGKHVNVAGYCTWYLQTGWGLSESDFLWRSSVPVGKVKTLWSPGLSSVRLRFLSPFSFSSPSFWGGTKSILPWLLPTSPEVTYWAPLWSELCSSVPCSCVPSHQLLHSACILRACPLCCWH